MKSVQTPWTKTGVTSQDVTTEVSGPSNFKEDLVVPAGTRVHYIGRWVVQDLTWLAQLMGQRLVDRLKYDQADVMRIGRNSIPYHDADHYGITVPESVVRGIKEVK